jgi:hypothetical protein
VETYLQSPATLLLNTKSKKKKILKQFASTKNILAAFLFGFTAFFFNSCRRDDLQKENKSVEQKELEAVAALKEKYKNITSVPVTIELNQKLESLVLMESGEEISWQEYLKRRSNGSLTDVVPDNCLEAPEQTILNASYALNCTNGTYTITGKYRILVDAQIVPQSPTNPNTKLQGGFDILIAVVA